MTVKAISIFAIMLVSMVAFALLEELDRQPHPCVAINGLFCSFASCKPICEDQNWAKIDRVGFPPDKSWSSPNELH